MRTTLEIDDDVVAEARQLARKQCTTLGHTISDLVRKSLVAKAATKRRNDVLPLTPKSGAPRADLELVNVLGDEE